ncbi:hypothetical protein CSQ93_28145 [Janthinobacterium sp. BJB426]|uniref:4'-phosphopantetheinyl transferase family protein n=1 Tax=Janthinobacterium sp. BJB426 TaxID=2048010 RepID=UPI000C0FACCB|nr:4'-phosphopantetheinyl transferase superfamily protein [Janthinobacterium sp. BJB426]PHV24668.1 hypothetical protein CSQ93_28145 [Janthinobacterium sp. BJB426]
MIFATADSIVEIQLGNETARIFLIHYDPASFSQESFASEAITLPSTIAGSVMKRQAEYFYGRLCAKFALNALSMTRCDVGTGRQREPVWPEHVVGSITHNHEFAAAIASSCNVFNGIGIDIEGTIGQEAIDAVLEISVSPRELAYLRTELTTLSFEELVTIVFSVKESFFKAVFSEVGHYFDFGAITVKKIYVETMQVTFEVNQFLSHRFTPGTNWNAYFRYFDPKTVLTIFVW